MLRAVLAGRGEQHSRCLQGIYCGRSSPISGKFQYCVLRAKVEIRKEWCGSSLEGLLNQLKLWVKPPSGKDG